VQTRIHTSKGGPLPNVPNNRIDGYSYDAAGNLLYDTFHNYKYDAENRLVSVDGATTYGYDAQDRRVSKTAGGSLTAFIYDREGHIIQTNPPTPTMIEINAAGLHLGTYILNSAGTDTIFYYDHSDWLGTERARTNLSGAACEKIVSLPFGDGQTITSTCGDISRVKNGMPNPASITSAQGITHQPWVDGWCPTSLLMIKLRAIPKAGTSTATFATIRFASRTRTEVLACRDQMVVIRMTTTAGKVALRSMSIMPPQAQVSQ
jgi:YD repeat-containing protein